MDQDIFSGFESCLLKRIMCGYEDLRNGARGRPLEIRRHRGHCILMRRHKFGMGSATDDPHNAIAFLPALSVRAQLCHFTGKFQPGNVLRKRPAAQHIDLPLQKVRAIERATAHVNENFVRSGLWCRNVLDFQNLRTTETSNNNSFHEFFALKD